MPVAPPVPPSPSIGVGYAYLTLTQALTQLSERLDDSGNIFWSQAELTSYLQTAMREWQSLTRYWRARMTFNLEQNQARNTEWYDLTQQSQLLLSYNVTDTETVAEMLYHLLEPQLSGSPLAYSGTDMFTLDDITQALQRRRDQFLVETGMLLNVTTQNWTPSTSGVQSLPDTIMDVRRAAWIDAQGVRTTLWKTDEWNAQSFDPNWAVAPADPPSGYSMATLGPLILQLIPPAKNSGQIELLSVPSGPALNPVTGVLMGVPDNFVWVVMFGALADLLAMAGESADPQRSTYCEQRYQEGVVAAKLFSSVETGYINGSQVFVGSVSDVDTMMANWQNTVDAPTFLGLAGYNMLATAPIPDNPFGAVQLAFDDFTRPNEDPLNSANWSPISTNPPSGALQIIGNACCPALPSGECIEVYIGVAFPPDQWAEIPMPVIAAGQAPDIIFIRGSTLNADAYFAYITVPAFGQVEVELLLSSGGNDIPLGTIYTGAAATGVPIRLGAIGTSIFVQVNGVTVIQVNDSTIAAGKPGLDMESIGAPEASCQIASFRAGSYTGITNVSGYSIMLDVAQNAPVPVNSGDKVQLGREELDAVLGEAQHLAAWKQGGDEFLASMPLHQTFMRLALLRNQRLAAAVPSKQPLYDRSSREEKQRVRVDGELPMGIGTDSTGQGG